MIAIQQGQVRRVVRLDDAFEAGVFQRYAKSPLKHCQRGDAPPITASIKQEKS